MAKKDGSMQKELKRHIGKWVAVCGKKVVYSARDPGLVMDRAKEICGDKETAIFRVHEKGQVLLL
jgi:hypothetical protein